MIIIYIRSEKTTFFVEAKYWVFSRINVRLIKTIYFYLNPPRPRWFTNRSSAVVTKLVLLFVALWFILRSDLFYVLPCVIVFLCVSALLAVRLPRLWKRELILVRFVRLSICDCLVLSVSSSSWCLGKAAVCDCCTPWAFVLPF